MQASDLEPVIARIMREDRGRLLSALMASLRSFDFAEDMLSEAMSSALTHWSRQGIPSNPQGWLLQVARRKAIDRIRKEARFRDRHGEIARLAQEDEMDANQETPEIPDERLRLILTCCHPALEQDAQVALTLRMIGGLSTAEIARGFLTQTPTMAARITRAKAKIKAAGIPFASPDLVESKKRMHSVMQVIYLIYNEGYAASVGEAQVRQDLCNEAVFLARLVVRLAPEQSEPCGLLALILFANARRCSRSRGALFVPLEEQDRSLWDREMIYEAETLLEAAIGRGQVGPYQVQAAIHGLHANARDAKQTDWQQIVGLYQLLMRMMPSDVVALNHAAAVSFAQDAQAGLELLTDLEPRMEGYQPYHAAKADMLARAGHALAASASYDRAIALSGVQGERAFLLSRQSRLQARPN